MARWLMAAALLPACTLTEPYGADTGAFVLWGEMSVDAECWTISSDSSCQAPVEVWVDGDQITASATCTLDDLYGIGSMSMDFSGSMDNDGLISVDSLHTLLYYDGQGAWSETTGEGERLSLTWDHHHSCTLSGCMYVYESHGSLVLPR